MLSPRALRAVVVAALALAASARAGGSIQEVYDCAVHNLPPSAHAHAQLVARSAGGEARTIRVEYWSRTSQEGSRDVVVKRAEAPDDEISAYLISDGDAIGQAWAFTRAKGKPERIETAGRDVKLFGTNVSVEDFARFARVLFPGQVRRKDDAEIGGRKVYVVETRPAPDAGSEYARIVTSIDQEGCAILRRDAYDPHFANGEKPRKVYRVEPADVRRDGGFTNANKARMEDALDGSSTELSLIDLQIPASLDETIFTPDALPRAAR